MRRALGLLARDSAVYGLAGGIARFVKVLLVPIVAKAFPAAIYGVFDSVGVYAFLLAALGVLGLDSAVILFARPAGGGAEDERRTAATQGLLLIVIATAVLGTGMAVGARTWSTLLFSDARYAPVFVWAGATVPCSAVLMYALSLLKWEFRRRWFLAASLGSALTSVLLTYFVAYHTDWGLSGLFAASLAGQAAGALTALIGCRDLLILRVERGLARRMLAIGVPFALIGAAAAFAPSLDRFFLARFHPLAEVGLYGLGQKIAALQALVLSGFQAAWGPFAVSLRDSTRKGAVYGRVLLLVAAVGVLMSTLLSLAAPRLAVLAASRSYGGAEVFVPPLALSATLGAVYFVVCIGAFLEGKSLFNLLAYVSGIGVTVVANILLVAVGAPAVGIAWANCGGQAAAVVCMAILSQRVHPIPFPFLRTALLLAAGGVVAVAGGAVAPVMAPAALAGAALVVIAAFGLAGWYAILLPAERRALRAMHRG